MEKGKCKLCLKEDVKLLSRSHIIPKFLFEDMKDENNSFVQIEPNKYVKGRTQHIKKPRDAFHEPDILCEKCDGIIIKRYEDYLKLVFHSTSNSISRPKFIKRIPDNRGFNILFIENLDYKLYKLGFLSILWRASISKLSFFRLVNLGPHSEVIRKMLLEGMALDIDDYPFFTSFLNQRNDEYQIVLPITKFKMEKYTHYRFIINGLDLMFMIGSKDLKLTESLLNYIPKPNGELQAIEHKENYGKKLFQSILLNSNDKRPKY
ncbi:hypothetical protein ACM55I_09745 [Flavobacterium sp. GB2R13]|uniref:hypothetical protein n=1 Tax=Flavobacterium algoris TaxID=3398733 RepID=UPI003A856874